MLHYAPFGSTIVCIMSNVAITIRTDDQSKKAIADFAASLGLSTSAFATAVLLQAVREQKVILTPALKPTLYLRRAIKQATNDRDAGKNVRSFDNTKEAISHLRSL